MPEVRHHPECARIDKGQPGSAKNLSSGTPKARIDQSLNIYDYNQVPT